MRKLNSMLRIAGLFMIFTMNLIAAGKGTISGMVVDSETGAPLIGANIYLENTSLGAASDLSGRYTITNIPNGAYLLVVSVIGYRKTEIANVVVKESQITELNILIAPEILTTEAVLVEAKAVKNTEASLLKSRQKSYSISDAISAEAMSYAGSDNAADAMKQVTGASVVDGKYVYIRGLSDRYTSIQLNGAEIPSTDPYRRSGSVDLIPSYLVDNIVTVKSFTPDKPGNFSGGTVNIKTKDFPEKLNITLGISSSVNPQANLSSTSIGSFSSGTDWLGYDDGSRALPQMAKGDLLQMNKAEKIAATREFNREMGPTAQSFPINQSVQLTYGNQVSLFNKPLGFIASASYKRDYNSYNDGIFQRWNLGAENAMENIISLNDAKSTDEVLWGILLKTSYQFSANHQISFNGLFNQNGINTARNLSGTYPYDLDEGKTFHTSVLSYKSRTLKSGQMNGEHAFPAIFGFRINWKASLGGVDQKEPDLRHFTNFNQNIDGENYYGIKLNTPPARYYRNLEEIRDDIAVDFSLPFKQWSGQSSTFKFGGLLANKERNFHERLFIFVPDKKYYYNGNRNELLDPKNIGVIDSSVVTIRGEQYITHTYGLSVEETILPANNYRAQENISALYAMIELPLSTRLRLVGGARIETTKMNLLTQDKKLNEGNISTEDLLPSLNLIYNLSQNVNIRAAYSKTLARPNFREIGPFATIDFVGGETYIGNPSLKRTLISNADLRWEWYSRPGEIFAISAFYKEFKNPIERVYNLFGESTWQNVNKASAYGIEFEIRKRLDIISSYLKGFTMGTNLSLIQSKVDISAEELALTRTISHNAPDERPFQGQSPYLVNLNLTYENPVIRLTSSLYYNRFGKRLYKTSYAATPDVYELPVDLLNFNIGWQFTDMLSIKFSAKNILNSSYIKVHDYKNQEYIYSRYNQGRSLSIGVGYRFF